MFGCTVPEQPGAARQRPAGVQHTSMKELEGNRWAVVVVRDTFGAGIERTAAGCVNEQNMRQDLKLLQKRPSLAADAQRTVHSAHRSHMQTSQEVMLVARRHSEAAEEQVAKA